MTFYFRINNFQDRIMISITMMLIISTLQSSIDKMVPKTSYLKMVDIFLIYSFNIVIVIMGVHTYMDMCIHRDSVTGIIVNKESRPSSVTKVQPMNSPEDTEGESATVSSVSSRVSSARSLVSSMWAGSEVDDVDSVDAFARARKVNLYGQIGFIAIFLLFMIIFWSVALNNYFSEIRFYDEHGMKMEDAMLEI